MDHAPTLDGDDDKHINLTDMAGVSLAAIQELGKQLSEKDERIANLEHKIAEYDHQLADIRAALADLKTDDQRLAKRLTRPIRVHVGITADPSTSRHSADFSL